MKKRMILFFMVAVLSCAVIYAAGTQEGDAAAAAAPEEASGELWVVYRAAVYHDLLFEPNLNEFTTANPKVKVTFQNIPHQEYTYKLQLMFASKNVPDVMETNLNQNYDFFATQGLFMDLFPYVTRDSVPLSEFLQPLIDRSKQPGGLYFIPLDSHPGIAGMFYNKTLFDEAGVAYPTNTWTYEDLLEAAKKLTIRGEDGKTKQFGLEAPKDWVAVMSVLGSFGGGWIDEEGKKSLLSSPGSVEAYTWLYELLHVHKVSPLPDQTLPNSFMVGQCAMHFAGPWEIGNTKAGMAEGYEVGIAPIPIGPEGRISGGVNYGGFVVPSGAKNKEAGWQFVKWTISDDMLYRVVENGLNLTTKAKINNMPEFVNDSWYKPYIDQLATGDYRMSPIPANSRVGEMRNTITQGFDTLWIGEKTVSEAIAEVEKNLQIVLDKPAP
jgi:multiple sugar transport system substrate-binding protein